MFFKNITCKPYCTQSRDMKFLSPLPLNGERKTISPEYMLNFLQAVLWAAFFFLAYAIYKLDVNMWLNQ